IRMFRPNTTPKKAISMKSTLRPVSGFGETNGLFIQSSSGFSRSDEIIGRRRNLAKPDIGDPESHRNRFLGVVLGGCRNKKSRSEEHTSELQSLTNLVCRLL